MKTFTLLTLAIFASVFVSAPARSQEKDRAVVPFFFSTDTLGTTLGLAGVAKGVGQKQAALFGMGLYSGKDSYIGYFAALNYALHDTLLVNTQMYQARYNDTPYYLADQGRNDASIDDATLTSGLERKYQLELRFLLPWGLVEQQGMAGLFRPQRSVSTASPLDSGVSSVKLMPFYSSRALEQDIQSDSTTGLKLTFDWDNRDNPRNATQGSQTSLAITSGTGETSHPWVKWELENSQFFSFGPLGDWFKQQVLALDFYTADTPSWEHCDNTACARPPEQEQVRLGGLYRLRGYSGGRYHDRAAVHYSLEYRVLPEWQPLNDIPLINYYDMPWWQWVLFADVGRVADEYDLQTLHQDMRWSVGGAIRFRVEGVVVRAELAKAADEDSFRVMINQPF